MSIKVTTDGRMLNIEVDTSQQEGPSSTGKTTLVASTHGFEVVSVDGKQISFSLNVTKKK